MKHKRLVVGIGLVLVLISIFYYVSYKPSQPSESQLRAAFPGQEREILKGADSFELLALNPIESDCDSHSKNCFHDFSILGGTKLQSGGKRQQIIAALYGSIGGFNEANACFNPRHGIRVVKNGKTLDIAICFECSQLATYGPSGTGGVAINRNGQHTFNAVLRAAHVPLPKY